MPRSAAANAPRTLPWLCFKNSPAIHALPAWKFWRTAARTCNTVGTSSISEMSTVSIIGQNGNPRSAMTRVLVCRTRLNRELIWGFKIPVFSMVWFLSLKPAQVGAGAVGQTRRGHAPKHKIFNSVFLAILAFATLITFLVHGINVRFKFLNFRIGVEPALTAGNQRLLYIFD